MRQLMKTMPLLAIVLFISAIMFGASAQAADSCNLFTSGAQSPGINGRVSIGVGATITGGDTALEAVNITDNGANLSCGSTDCTVTGLPSTASTFTYPSISYGTNTINVNASTVTSSGGTWQTVSVDSGGTVEFTEIGGTYEIQTLTLNGSGRVILAPGDYFIANGLNLNNGAQLEVSSGTARIFTPNAVTINSGVILTGVTSAQSLFVWADNGMNLQSGGAISGYFYTPNQSINMSSNTVLTGAASAENTVNLGNNAQIIYVDPVSLDTTDLCVGGGPATPATLVAEWRFDNGPWDGTAGELADDSGNGLDGAANTSAAVPASGDSSPAITGSPGTCGYGDFSGSADTYFEIADPGTNSVLDWDGGESVSISAWVYVNDPTDQRTIISKNDNYRLRIDGSELLNVKWDHSGGTKVIYSTASLATNSWSHVAVTLGASEQKIYINGALDSTHSSATNGLQVDNTILAIGARSSGLQNFDGLIDEVKIFSGLLSLGEVSALATATHTCPSLAPPTSLIAEWRFDEFGWDTTASGVADSSGNGHHGTVNQDSGNGPITSDVFPAVNGALRTCSYGVFDDENTSTLQISDPGTDSVFDMGDDAYYSITAWVKVEEDTPSSAHYILRKGPNYRLYIRSSRELRFQWKMDGIQHYMTYSGSTLDVGSWYHVALTVSPNEQVLYINGSAVETQNNVMQSVETDNSVIVIGDSANGDNTGMSGSIDEVRLYEGILTSSEINTIQSEVRTCTDEVIDLVGEWRMDESSWSGAAGEVLDNSGNGLHSVAVDVTALPFTGDTDADAAIPSSVGTCGFGNFNGSADGYLELSDPGVNSVLDLDRFTISAWVYIDSLGADHSIVMKGGNYEFYVNSAGQLTLDWNAGPSWFGVNDSGALAVGQWHHVAATFRPGEQRLFVNGSARASTLNWRGPQKGSNKLYFGHDNAPTGRDMTGRIDEVRIYRGVLSEAGVTAVAAEVHACPEEEPVLVAEWRLDETSDYDGATGEVLDSSGNALHGSAFLGTPPKSALTNPVTSDSPSHCRYLEYIEGTTTEINVPHNTLMDFNTSNEMTLMAWVHPTASSLVADAIVATKTSNYILYLETDLKVKLAVIGDLNERVWSSSSLPVDTWTHVAVSFKDGEQKIYLNGVLDTSETKNFPGTVANTNTFRIGDNTGDLGALIDEVKLYRGILDAPAVTTAMNETRACPSVPVTLAGEWRLDELVAYDGTAGEVVDNSGNNLHATAVNGSEPLTSYEAPVSSGDESQCRYGVFDALTADSLSINDHSLLDYDFGDEMTVMLWLNPNAAPVSRATLLAKEDNYELVLETDLRIRLKINDGGTSRNIYSTSSLTLNDWTHVAVSFKHIDQKLYLNGVLDNSTSKLHNNAASNSNVLKIGDIRLPAGIDEARVYRGLLSLAEINTAMNEVRACPEGTDPPSLIAQWHFDEFTWDGTPNEALDSGVNGYHGTANNTAAVPNTFDATPALAGATGTCRYGVFGAASNTEIVVADPGSDSDFDFGDSDSYSIMAWVYLDGTPLQNGTIIRKNDNYRLVATTANKIQFTWDQTGGPQYMVSASSLSENVWYHIALTVTPNARRIYINGVEDVLNTTAANIVEQDDSPILIGAKDSGLSAYDFNGFIDEVRIYRGALSSGEVNTVKDEVHICPQTSDNLAAEWRFDEYEYTGIAGELLDSGGNGLHGTGIVAGTAQFPITSDSDPAVSGSPGTCRYFDATTSNGAFEIADPGAGSVFDAKSFTVTAWVKQDVLIGDEYNIINKSGNYKINIVNGKLKIYFYNEYTSLWQGYTTPASVITAGNWHHVAVTFTDGEQNYYVDGSLVATLSDAGDPQINNNPVYVGTNYNNDDLANMAIDEVRFYNRVLAQAEVSAIMTETRTCTLTSDALIAEYRFEETDPYTNQAGEVLDSSGNGFDGASNINGTSAHPAQDDTLPAISGNPGSCQYVDFDGSNDGFLYVPDPGANSDLDLQGNFTLSTWIYISEWPAGANYSAIEKQYHFAMDVTSGGAIQWWWIVNGGWVNFITPNNSLILNNWHHVALVHQNGNQKIYIDGVELASASFSGTINDTSSTFNIGSYNINFISYKGALDEVRIYNGALNKTQINEIKAETHTCPITVNTPTAQWNFDETGWDGTAEEVEDSSGNGFDLSAVDNGGYPTTGDSSPAQSGDPGTCAYGVFDGANDGHVEIADPGTDSDLDLTDNFSVALWINMDSLPANPNHYTVFEKADAVAIDLTPWNSVNFQFNVAGSWQSAQTGGSLVAGTWAHVVVTFESGSQKVYIDGVHVSTAGHAGVIAENSHAIKIGGASSSPLYFDGSLDEVRIYQKVLSLSEVTELMNSTRTCPTTDPAANLVAQWQFEEFMYDGTLGEVIDSSGNEYHGTADTATEVPTTDFIDPAITGIDAGTCRYAVFDGADDSALDIQDLGSDSVFDMGDSDELTITAWVKLTATTSELHHIVTKGVNYKLQIGADRKIRHVWQTTNPSTVNNVFNGTTVMDVGTWYHIAVTAKHGDRKLYLNGVLEASNTNTATGYDEDDTDIELGAMDGGSVNPHVGYLDEVRIYNKVLSAGQLAAVMAQTHACPSADGYLEAEYLLNNESYDGSAGELVDSSGGGHHGAAYTGTAPSNIDTLPAISGDPGSCSYASFNGAADTMLVSADTDLHYDYSEQKTVMGWFKIKSTPSDRIVLFGRHVNYRVMVDSNMNIVVNNWDGDQRAFSGATTLALDTWYHVAVTMAPSDRKIYVNGVLDSSDTYTLNTSYGDTGAAFAIGDNRVPLYPADADIDEVRVYSRALSSAEIIEALNQTNGCASLDDALVGSWSFEEFIWDGVAGEVKDDGPNALDGQAGDNSTGILPVVEGSSPALTGDPGSCRYAQTLGSTDGFITVPDTTDSPLDLANAYSISAWIKVDNLTNTHSIMRKSGAYRFRVTASGALRFVWFSGGNEIKSANGLIVPGSWYHVAIAYSDSRQRLFINGEVVASEAINSPTLINDSALEFGNGSGTLPWPGSMDEVRIYSKELSPYEVQQVMAQNHACVDAEAALVAEWRFDDAAQWDGTSNELVDSGPNSLHGSAPDGPGYPQLDFNTPAIGNITTGTCSYADFSGTQSYFEILDPGTDSVLDTPEEYTLSMWVRPHEVSADALNPTIYSKKSMGQINHEVGTSQVRFWWNNGSANSYDSASALSVDTWHHIAVTFKNGLQKTYINGAEDASAAITEDSTPNNDSIFIGRFQTDAARDFEGDIDEVRIHNKYLGPDEILALMNTTRACPAGVVPALVEISGASVATTCAPQTVTITIKNATNQTLTNYTGTITLNTSTGHGDWSKTDIATDAQGNLSAGLNDGGSALYTFVAEDAGSITLSLTNGRTETLTVSGVENIAGASGVSTDIAFSTNSFVFSATGRSNHIAGRPDTWTVEMKTQDPDTGVCATNTNYMQAGVKIWLTRKAQDAGGALPTVEDNATATSMTVPDSEPLSNNFNLTFVNGIANFTLTTTDVISFSLNVADDSLGFADVVMTAYKGDLNYAPFGFYVSASGNPGATSGGGAIFKDAGDNFTVNVAAVGWDAADDLDDNGIPDGHNNGGATGRANLADNLVLASFGHEVPNESITLTATLLLPFGGSDPGLSNGDSGGGDGRIVTSFSGGAGATSNVYFDEVGIIELQAEITDGEYMAKGADKTGLMKSYSNNVGRFIPATFKFVSGELTAACDSALDFSYMEQSFDGELAISPQSQKNTVLQNYTGDFIKLTLGAFDFFARDTNTASVLTSRLLSSADAMIWVGSEATVTTSFALARGASPDGPFETVRIGTDFNDGDGVPLKADSKDLDVDADGDNDASEIGETEARFGRLRIGDAHGPETNSLNVPLVVEFWQSPDWLINEDDSCTELPLTVINYPMGGANVEANRTVTVGGGSTIGSYAGLASGVVPFISGEVDHAFSAPGVGNLGNFETSIDLTAFPWLQYDWDADGSYSDSQTPDNQINFGSYRGHDRMIFWQEY